MTGKISVKLATGNTLPCSPMMELPDNTPFREFKRGAPYIYKRKELTPKVEVYLHLP